MYQDERLIEIKKYLKDHKRITVSEMMERYEISRDTARRDLVKLEKDTDVIRTRGGAKLRTSSLPELSKNSESNGYSALSIQRITNYAKSIVKEGDSLLLDGSKTVESLTNVLTTPHIKVVTNAIALLHILSEREHVHIHLLGGRYNKNKSFLYGPTLIKSLNDFHTDKVFIGAEGMTAEGISYSSEEEALVNQAMIKRGDEVIVLIRHSSFGSEAFYRSIQCHQIDKVITDKHPGAVFEEIFEENNVELIVADKSTK
ncbi:DeoR/GlpR family DNA-binding transcription regulator [Pseudalkalibacillus sp. Hm43]|uniref:DeoR/GlpR family DNA-binding transcription regulator n=1 Tax=Pseudalkalibacillus sp. Hm43 TaxID=3450742 RepID=UPI003F4361D1